jgi:hypothetical protein
MFNYWIRQNIPAALKEGKLSLTPGNVKRWNTLKNAVKQGQ